MADAYFRVRHQPVATLTSCGPGSCNIVMPLQVALSDSSALLAITANVPTQQFNRSPFQEINKHFQADFPSIVRPVVKRSFQPTRVDMLPLAMRQAMTTMLSGRPGTVNVDVPFNVFQEEDDVEVPRAPCRAAAQRQAQRRVSGRNFRRHGSDSEGEGRCVRRIARRWARSCWRRCRPTSSSNSWRARTSKPSRRNRSLPPSGCAARSPRAAADRLSAEFGYGGDMRAAE